MSIMTIYTCTRFLDSEQFTPHPSQQYFSGFLFLKVIEACCTAKGNRSMSHSDDICIIPTVKFGAPPSIIGLGSAIITDPVD